MNRTQTPEPNPARFHSTTITTKGTTMKRFIAGGATALLLAGGIVAASVVPASAHTPAASATCEAITISAVYYETKPESGSPTIPNPAYVPAVPGTPAVGTPTITVDNPDYVAPKDAVTVTEFEWRGLFDNWGTIWSTDRPYIGWWKTGAERVTEISPAVEGVGTPTIEIANPAYVPAVPEVPAQGEPTIPNPAYQAADATPNTVTVTVDGTQVYSERFGQSHTATIPLDGKTKHSWVASFVGWNGVGTQTITGKTSACPPVGITVPDLTVTPPTCDAHGSLPFLGNPAAQNPNGYEFPGQGFRVYLDKPFEGAGTYVATLQKIGAGFDPAFPYGTKITGGNTTQTLTVLGATGTQDTDPEAPCYVEPEVPVEPETPTTPEAPTTPTDVTPTDEGKTVTTATARTATQDYELAETGADPAVTLWGLSGGALAVALGALTVVLGLRRRQVAGK
ncbi:hypothetical protein QDA02_gp31 [Microbacterium phage Margaery]|uniref:Uncharacterized protein n=1 Tax=Microbacterium phage Margaery TaxID=2591217 RepID=A0A514DHR0_9CAUD|nr:hypothetical protein QDA02_gp31 [Microbacterium phage Margaery]QDH93134.1 hypothetical protein PBI_MARGAERY_77 [Microbacterium phage Margaery]